MKIKGSLDMTGIFVAAVLLLLCAFLVIDNHPHLAIIFGIATIIVLLNSLLEFEFKKKQVIQP